MENEPRAERRVRNLGIGAEEILGVVALAVAVGVECGVARIVRIHPVRDFPRIGNAVAVGVNIDTERRTGFKAERKLQSARALNLDLLRLRLVEHVQRVEAAVRDAIHRRAVVGRAVAGRAGIFNERAHRARAARVDRADLAPRRVVERREVLLAVEEEIVKIR